jgi:hypothetical protein
MTRSELYDLVWSKPMTHVAKEFGMSDVAVRKHCVKHDIPTPPLGYWAKLAHGKSVKRPALPTRQRPADEYVDLTPRDPVSVSTEAEEVRQRAERERIRLEGQLRVPEELPEKPHVVVRSLRAALRKTKADAEGFLDLKQDDLPGICIGRASKDRVLCLFEGLFNSCEQEGHTLVRSDGKFRLEVDGEPFKIRVYATKDRRPHEPTPRERREQEERERWRAAHPEWYSTRRAKAYRSWDYFPSERLTLEICDTNDYSWREHALVKRWRDRESAPIESRFGDIFVWLKPAAVAAKEKRLEIEEKRRKREEEERRRAKLRERREKAGKIKEYLESLAAKREQLSRIESLVSFLSETKDGDDAAVACLIGEAAAYHQVLLCEFHAEKVRSALAKLGVLNEDEVLIPALLEKPEEPYLHWLHS